VTPQVKFVVEVELSARGVRIRRFHFFLHVSRSYVVLVQYDRMCMRVDFQDYLNRCSSDCLPRCLGTDGNGVFFDGAECTVRVQSCFAACSSIVCVAHFARV